MQNEAPPTAFALPAAAPVPPEFVTADDVAAMLRVSRRTVFRMRQRNELPPPVEVSRHIVRWRLADLREFVNKLPSRQSRRRTESRKANGKE
jgi:predicted DNA-binding transcriptional regulator AlpA